MNEHTLVKTLPLPYGQEWAWFADANVVALSPCLATEDARQEALSQVQAHWRRSCLRIVPDGASASLTTQPLTSVSVVSG